MAAVTLEAPRAETRQLSVIRDLDSFERLAPAWRRLLARTPGRTVFQTFEWNAVCARLTSPGVEIAILVAREGNEVVGIAPMKLVERSMLGRRRRVLEFLAFPSADYCDVIVEPDRPDVLASMLAGIFDLTDWDVIDFANILSGSSTLAAIQTAIGAEGFPALPRPACDAPAYVFENGEADEKLAAKKSLRRHYNALSRIGRLQFRHLDASETPAYLEQLFEQHVHRWAGTETPSRFVSEYERRFSRDLAAALGPAGWLRFGLLTLAGEPIAFHFGFEYERRFLWYLPSFDIRLMKSWPGEVLLKFVLEYARDQRLAEFDFAVGEEPYKYRFANEVRRINGLQIFRSSGLHRAVRLAGGAKSIIKRSEILARLGRQALTHLGR